MGKSESASDSRQGRRPGILKKAPTTSGGMIKLWCLISASVIALFSLSAMIGWHLGQAAMFQLFPQFAPMQYNTALGFLCCALALFFATKNWRTATLIATTPALLLSALTLVEHFYGVEIGRLDQLFVEPYVTDRTAHPGRPSFLTSLSFFLICIALFGAVVRIGRQINSQITAVLSSLVISISLLGMTGYLFGLTEALSWSLLAQMSVPTVISFMALATAVLALSWRNYKQSNHTAPGWAPIAVLIATVTITLILGNAIRSEEIRNVRLNNHSNATAIQITLEDELADRQRSIRRMASRWAVSGKPDRQRWEADVEQYLADDTGYTFIAWADESLTYRWVVPKTSGITPGVSIAAPEGANPMGMLHQLARSANVGIRQIGNNPSDLGVVAPIVGDDGRVGGYIIAKFNNRIFFSALLPKELAQGYDFTVFMNDRIIHHRGLGGIPRDKRWITEKKFNLHGSDWKIELWPTEKTLRAEHIAYSKLIGGMGLVASGLLALAVYLAQVAGSKSRQSAQRNVRLQEEIAERIRSQEQLQRASALNEAIVEHSAHAVISTDVDGIITSFNPAAERMLGYKAGELVGKHTPAIIHDPAEVEARAMQLSRQYKEKIEPGFDVFVYESRKGIDSQVDWTYVRKNGSRFPVSLAVTAITNHEDAVIGYLGVAVDISELKYTMEELKRTHQQLLDSALETSRMKSQFLANMSHEIRTPMNGVLGMAELLEDTDLTDAQREYVGIINQSGRALLTIINDILDSAKIESGRIDLKQTPFDLRELVRGVMQTVGTTAAKKGVELQSQIDDKITSRLMGDPGRLRQVLLNLVSNAVKFTNDGAVELSIELLGEKDDHYRLHFKVTDSGIGINPGDLSQIFQPFTQVDDTNRRLYGGTGLGLTISSQIVQAMGGAIRARSEKEKGSEFWFELNIPTTKERVVEREPSPAPGKKRKSRSITQTIRLAQESDRRLSILLVEDNPVNQQVTSMQLKRLGIDADIAENGEEALKALEKKQYDVILMDCQMPVMDGYDATRKIREKHPDSPYIIALTANAMKEDRQRCLDCGMNDYLSKPLTANDLAVALERMNSNEQSDSQDTDGEQEEAPAAVDFGRLREVTGDDDDLLRQISTQYLEQADEIISDLEEAIQTADHKQSSRLAHKLAGSSATCGMNAVVEPLREIETLKSGNATEAAELLEEVRAQMDRIRQELKNHP